MFFSVIVPVYNIAKYLPKCLDSILANNNSLFEIILVDDGSNDFSGDICDEYQSRNKMIKVIHQENMGLSMARNKGMEAAKGEYIIFIDGDDYITDDAFKHFYEILKENRVDVLITQLIEVYPSRQKILNAKINYLSVFTDKTSVIEDVFKKSEVTWPVVRYILRREFVVKNKLVFKRGITQEDIDFTPQIFLYAKNFAYCNEHWYYHVKEREGAITASTDVSKVLDVINILSFHIDHNMYVGLPEKKLLFQRLSKSLYPMLRYYKFFSLEDKKRVIKALKENKHILKYAVKFKHRIFNFLINVCGYRFSLWLMGRV